jgi:hypothetical protein
MRSPRTSSHICVPEHFTFGGKLRVFAMLRNALGSMSSAAEIVADAVKVNHRGCLSRGCLSGGGRLRARARVGRETNGLGRVTGFESAARTSLMRYRGRRYACHIDWHPSSGQIASPRARTHCCGQHDGQSHIQMGEAGRYCRQAS